MRVTVVHNPTAGGAQAQTKTIAAALAAAGHEARWQSLKVDGWERVLDEPADLVVVAGGDGSVRKVFLAIAGKPLPVTLLPIGSANNIARSLGVMGDEPERLIQGWDGHRLRSFDVGVLAGDRESPFVEAVGGGLFADVLALAAQSAADPSGEEKVEHGLQLLLDAVTAAEPSRWQLAVDGRALALELLAVEVTNVRETGPNVPLAPDADPGDGLLEAVLIRAEDRRGFLDYVQARLAGDDAVPPSFEAPRGARIELRPPAGVRLHVDDELTATTPAVAVAAATARLQVWVPEDGNRDP
jgi:diacylglycerol kinase family enzyme